VKWLFSVALSIILIVGLIYVYLHRQELGLRFSNPAPVENTSVSAPTQATETGPAPIVWEKIDRSSDGFKVEMPTGVQQTQVPAYDESGGEEPVQMIFSNPSADTTFSVAWADNPPVVRVNRRSAERMLEMARDEALNHQLRRASGAGLHCAKRERRHHELAADLCRSAPLHAHSGFFLRSRATRQRCLAILQLIHHQYPIAPDAPAGKQLG
jgi:hypothetical protein